MSARPITAAWALAGGLLFVLTLAWLCDRPRVTDAGAARRALATSSPTTDRSRLDVRSPDATPHEDATLSSAASPWHATPSEPTSRPAGTVPVSRVDPPPPDPAAPLPPPPVEPPNPTVHRPALHNPGGVNADRPERRGPALP